MEVSPVCSEFIKSSIVRWRRIGIISKGHCNTRVDYTSLQRVYLWSHNVFMFCILPSVAICTTESMEIIDIITLTNGEVVNYLRKSDMFFSDPKA